MWIAGFLFAFYVAAINATAFILYWHDKERALEGTWRIPERTLLLAGLLGGSIGGAIAQHVFHHKTRKVSFQNAFWFIATIQAAAIVFGLVLLLD
jgi:uncharacterized membrane protein YsdA (DUF1294 family)